MQQNGGFATLGHLNREVLKVPDVEWKTQTPYASIRRIVQDKRFFFKIKPGLWALLTYKDKLPEQLQPAENISKHQEQMYSHSYFQGLLVEIGNLRKYETFVPNQDKNKLFLERRLGDVCSPNTFYEFGYDPMVRKARTIDVSWFNDRKMPIRFFEVEHSTDIQNSLLKFMELQDFNVGFFIVADSARKREFKSKLAYSAFKPIKGRVQFLDYENLSVLHSKEYEYRSLEIGWF